MRSIKHKDFTKMFSKLPSKLQDEARQTFQKWKEDPALVDWHRLSGTKADFYAASIGYHARAIALVTPDAKGNLVCCWVFIGTHETYNNFINQKRDRNQKSYVQGLSENQWNPPIKQKLSNRRRHRSKATVSRSSPSCG